MKPSDLPPLEGWMALPDAATELGMSRQRAHQLLQASREREYLDPESAVPSYFITARRAGTVIMVRTAEVMALKSLRGSRAAPAAGEEGENAA